MSDARSAPRAQDIAVIGLAVRMPGAPDAEAFWRNLERGVDATTRFTAEQLVAAGLDPSLVARPDYVKAAPMLDDATMFDAAFFGFTPLRAQVTDPQHRILLECAHEALTDAAIVPASDAQRTGVFVGCGANGYLTRNLALDPELLARVEPAQVSIGNQRDFVATLLSYAFDLKGPSVSVSTACSTSLVAVHLACRSLLTHECDVALAGGVSINVPLVAGYLWREGGITSPDGRCRAFDARAAGTIFGSGAGVVVLKRLTDALADGDPLRAVILGSAVNNDGAAKVGYTAPGFEGQAQVVAEALAVADVDPATISYVEAHGTGTRLGDPVEIAALTRAFGARLRRGSCAIGSVKTNVGHLNTAAGIAGFVKTVLALEHGVLPPSLHCDTPNPEIRFAETPFFVVTERRPWTASAHPRRAGVSAFGVGGTNAHVVLEEAPRVSPPTSGRRFQILPLAARTTEALAAMAPRLRARLELRPDLSLADVAYTLQVGRAAEPHRHVLVCGSREEALAQLAAPPRADERGEAREDAPPRVAFLFPGATTVVAGLGHRLYETEPAFRAAVDACADRLQPALGANLVEVLYRPRSRTDLVEPLAARFGGPALFAIEHALAELWRTLGVTPALAVGDGVGAWVAACVAGALDLDTALELVAARATLEAGQPALERFLETAAAAAWRAPRIPLAGAASGAPSGRHAPLDARRWASQWQPASGTESDPLRWLEPIRASRASVLLEVGPRSALGACALARREEVGARVIPGLPGAAGDEAEAALAGAAGQLWLEGVAIDWPALHAGAARRRVSLPGYPFERRSRWVGSPAARPARDRAATGAGARFYVSGWRSSVLAGSPPAAAAPVRWLLFADSAGLGDALASRLRSGGHEVVIVRRGAPSIGDGPGDDFGLDPASPADLDALLARLSAEDRAPHRIVYLWPVPTSPAKAAADRGSHVDASFHGLLDLARSLTRFAPSVRIPLVVVTCAAHDTGAEEVDPLEALALGPCRTIRNEYPQLRSRNVDVLLPRDGVPAAHHVIAQLVAELSSEADDVVVAYRGNHRRVHAIEAVDLPASPGTSLLRREGVYLVTGGLGGAGLLLARELARAVRARLILMSRAPFPERAAWDAWLAGHDAADPTSRRIQALREIEALGGSVLTVSADVTREAEVREVVERAVADLGALHGVLHCAGVPDGAVIHRRSRAMSDAVLAPKVEGTLVLERCLADVPLDFIVVCSSLAALSGDVGQVAYCSANAFLDAWAASRTGRVGRSGARAISIAWDRWRDVGMAAAAPAPSPHRRRALDLALVTAEAGASGEYVSVLSTGTHWVLDEHRVAGAPVLPAVALLEIVAEIAAVRAPGRPIELRDVRFLRTVTASDRATCEVVTSLTPGELPAAFAIASSSLAAADGRGVVHARGHVSFADTPARRHDVAAIVAELRASPIAPPPAPAGTLTFGPHWGVTARRLARSGDTYALLELPRIAGDDAERYVLHPSLLDCAASIGASPVSAGGLFMPTSIERVTVRDRLPSRVLVHARPASPAPEAAAPEAPDSVAFDVTILDEHGAELVTLERWCWQRVDPRWVLERDGREARGRGLEAADAVDAFHRVLAVDLCNVMVAAAQLPPALAGSGAIREAEAVPVGAPAAEGEIADPIESAMCRIWQEVFGVERVGRDSDFFELNGDSLMAIQLMARVREHYGVALPVGSVFESPTVAGLVERVRAIRATSRRDAGGAGASDAGREVFEL